MFVGETVVASKTGPSRLSRLLGRGGFPDASETIAIVAERLAR